jgi:ATP-binding cassette, subfamily B, multidrug efflux pump
VLKLGSFLGQNKKYVVFCFFLVTGDVVCELLMPILMAKIVDVGIPQKDLGFIVRIGGLMVGLAGLAIGLGILNMKFSSEASQGFAANIRKALFEKVLSFSFNNIDTFNSGSLITRLTSDVTQLQNTLMISLRMLLRAPLMLVCAITLVLTISTRLSLIVFIAIPILILSIVLVLRSAERLFTIMQQKLDTLNGTVQENLIAIRVVKAFVREAHEKLKFQKANGALMKSAIDAGYLASIMMPIMMLVLNFATIFAIWFGGKMVVSGSLGTGALISFLSYLMQILMSVMMFSMMFLLYARAKACTQRIVEVIDTPVTITNNASIATGQSEEPLVKQGRIDFEHVDFRYAIGIGKNVLSDISFSVNPGEIVAILGATGSGKSSLLYLIPRLYDVTGGRVLVDGTDVRNYRLETLRAGIGVVLQNNVLFSGSIRENLLWGNQDASQQEMDRCTQDAQAFNFITDTPNSYKTLLGQGGVNISGGQKQRLCIARAMLKKPRILILDDSTSAVDTATEAKIRQAFFNNLKDTTVLIVSQRISSVKDADKIIVLDDGRISGIGSHESLRENNAIYREICLSQEEGLAD